MFYTVAALDVHDQETYAEYVRLARKTLTAYPEARLAADNSPTLIEGERLPAQRWVLLQFESEKDFHDWYDSAEYRAAMEHRLQSSRMQFKVMLKGHE